MAALETPGAEPAAPSRHRPPPPPPPPPPAPSGTTKDGTDGNAGTEAFVTYAQGRLKVFNATKDFGFISPVFRRGEDSEGPPIKLPADEGLWFFGNHRLPPKTQPGVVLSFEVWENSDGRATARGVSVASEHPAAASLSVSVSAEDSLQPTWSSGRRGDAHRNTQGSRRHYNEPRVIYPSVYVSDVPVEYTEDSFRDLHRSLGLNPDSIMGLKFLPFTEVSLGKQAAMQPLTGSVILRYCNQDAATSSMERLKGQPVRASNGQIKYLGARHAAPAKWMMERKGFDSLDDRRDRPSRQGHEKGQALMQKIQGVVARVSAGGTGVIKCPEWGEVMWRQYELPSNLRALQFADPEKFQQEVESRTDYRRLKEMEGQRVEAELYRLPDGQLRAWHLRALDDSGAEGSSGGVKAITEEAHGADCIVCVHPLPSQWTDAEVKEHFKAYQGLKEVSLEYRLISEDGNEPEATLLGCLRFEDASVAQQVIEAENGAALAESGRPVMVSQGTARRRVGLCEGTVIQYLPDQGVGLMRTPQVEGDVHFVASASARQGGLDLRGLRLEAHVEYGGDGCPQGKDVSVLRGAVQPGRELGAPGMPSGKGRRQPRSDSGAGPMPASTGMLPGWGGMNPLGPSWGAPLGAAPGQDLRAAPEALMMQAMMAGSMSPFGHMMPFGLPFAGMKKEKKAKDHKHLKQKKEKEKKEKKRKKRDEAEEEEAYGFGPPADEAADFASGRRESAYVDEAPRFGSMPEEVPDLSEAWPWNDGRGRGDDVPAEERADVSYEQCYENQRAGDLRHEAEPRKRRKKSRVELNDDDF